MSASAPNLHVCHVIHGVDRAIAFEWICDQLDHSIQQSFILTGHKPGHLYKYLQEVGKEVFFIPFSGRKKAFPKLALQLYKYFLKLKPDVVHAHIYPIPLLALFAAKMAGVQRRIYTRHHSTINLDLYPRVAYLDRRVNQLATTVVAISDNVKSVLQERENVPEHKIQTIPHGFDLSLFEAPSPEQIQALKQKYELDGGPVFGVIARFNFWKGHKYIISAFQQLLSEYPRARFVFANANGPDHDRILEQIQERLPPGNVRIIKFEPEVHALYHTFDYYVHTPIDPYIEAYGQTYVEALAAGIPSVFTLSGIAHEFIRHEHNALVVPYKNDQAIYSALKRLLSDSELREHVHFEGKRSVYTRFDLAGYITKLNELYS